MGDRPGEAEVTNEMIQAGINASYEVDLLEDERSRVVEYILRAALSAAPQPRSK